MEKSVWRSVLLSSALGSALWGCSPQGADNQDPPSAEQALQAAPALGGMLYHADDVMPIVYKQVGALKIFEGDILLTSKESGHLKAQNFGIADASRGLGTGSLWPNAVVYYRFDSTISPSLMKIINSAISHISVRTGVQFIEDALLRQPNRIVYHADSGVGCNSYVGMVGGEQTINLGPGCEAFDIVVHEIGHALGLLHEQTRPDRDNYINIITSNIKPEWQSQFAKWTGPQSIFGEFDYDSVMEYNSYCSSAAINSSLPCITRKDGSTFIAQDGSGLSRGDVLSVTSMYSISVPGAAVDVGVGPSLKDDLWVVGTDAGIYHWQDSGWVRVPGAASRIDVGPSGPVVLNNSKEIFRWNGSGWTQMPGAATDVGVAANGALWVIGTNSVYGGYGIYRWNGSNWETMPGGAVAIDLEPNGTPWVLNDQKQIFRWNGSGWTQYPGLARDIGIGADGSIWVIGDNSGTGGYGIYRWLGSSWVQQSGMATRIAGSPFGRAVVLNSYNGIFVR